MPVPGLLDAWANFVRGILANCRFQFYRRNSEVRNEVVRDLDGSAKEALSPSLSWRSEFAAYPGFASNLLSNAPDQIIKLAALLSLDSDTPVNDTLVVAGSEIYRWLVRGTLEAEASRQQGAASREVDRLAEKLGSHGPMGLRDIVRTYDRQDYTQVRSTLSAAIAAGRVVENGRSSVLLDEIMNTVFLNRPLSVCECVSAGSDETETRNPNPACDPTAGAKRRKVSLCGRKPSRGTSLQIGHRSFAAGYQVDPTPTIRTRRVDLRGHCLLYCENAQILIRQGELQHLLAPGDAALLFGHNRRDLRVARRGRHLRRGLLFFLQGDEELAELVPVHPRANMLLFRSAEFPCPEGFIAFPKVPMRFVYDPAVGIRGVVRPLLTLLFNQIHLPMWKLCLRRVVIRRLMLQIYIENLVLRPAKDHGRILEKFPAADAPSGGDAAPQAAKRCGHG